MVKIVVKFKILKGYEEEYLENLKKCILATRQEPGCLEYTAYWNSGENILTLFECFKDTDAAEKHLEYPHYKDDFKALKKYYDGKAAAERYEDPII